MWLDELAFVQWLRLRERFRVRTLVETGTARGIGTAFYAHHFREVISCDSDAEMIKMARVRLRQYPNAALHCEPSPTFLRYFTQRYERARRRDIVMFFLDAHSPGHWPILDELRALEGFTRSIIIIHDFDIAGLGHISLNNQPLNWQYVSAGLRAVNPRYRIYHNSQQLAEVVSEEEIKQGQVPGLAWDNDTRDSVRYAWSSPEKTYRGMLYATPGRLDDSFELNEMAQEVKGWTWESRDDSPL